MRTLKFLVFAFFLFVSIRTASAATNVNQAKEFMQAGMYPQAIAVLEKEIYGDEKAKVQANPTNAEAQFLLGVCYVNKGRYNDADERFASAVRLNSNYGYKIGTAYKDVGQAFMDKGQLREADDLFKKALGFEPGLRKQISTRLFETGKRHSNDQLLFLAATYDQGLRGPIAEYYYSLSKSAKGDEDKIDLLGKAAEYDEKYSGEYHENKQGLGRFHLDEAKKWAKVVGKEDVANEHKLLARKYLGDAAVEAELPEEKVFPPSDVNYEFSLAAGEQTPYWIVYPVGKKNIGNFFATPSCQFETVYDDGYVAKKGERVSERLRAKYKFRAVTNCSNDNSIGLQVK